MCGLFDFLGTFHEKYVFKPTHPFPFIDEFLFQMTTLQAERRRITGTPSSGSQRWPRTKTTSLRTTSGDRNSFGQEIK
jgi:hypothetical protein